MKVNHISVSKECYDFVTNNSFYTIVSTQTKLIILRFQKIDMIL